MESKYKQRTKEIMTYNSFGFDCLVIWGSELETKTEQELVQSIKTFNRRKHG